MNEKRLEEIEKRLSVLFFKPSRTNGKAQLLNDLQWLIEQAERVQELEKQNKRYKKALEEIRDMGIYGKIISTDEANLAEEALKGEEIE